MHIVVHMISHTHWDREWYAGSRFTNEWLPPFFEKLFEMLEKEPEYRFVLDGQLCMVEDCLEQLKKEGKDMNAFRRKLRQYASAGRLILGPYYVQPDWQLVSGEALVRNLELGRQLANFYGEVSLAGWLPDNFGQISQTPQLHRQFGISGVFVWRGVEMEPEELRSEFRWRSPDGSEVLAVYLVDGYRNGMRLAAYPDIFWQRVLAETEKIRDFASTGNVLLLNGYDQETRPDDILPLLRQRAAESGSGRTQKNEGPRGTEGEAYENRNAKKKEETVTLRQSTPAEYLTAVAAQQPVLPVLEGALYSGRFISVFPGTLSCRIYLKLQNDWCQNMLSQYAEPLQALLAVLEANGGPAAGWVAGNQEETDGLWKLLLQNHPHDSICGVGVDEVHTDMEKRFHACAMGALRICREGMRRLGNCITADPNAYLVFNPYPAARDSVFCLPERGLMLWNADGTEIQSCQSRLGTLVRLPEIPPFGYQIFYGAPSSEPVYSEVKQSPETKQSRETEQSRQGRNLLPVLENSFLRAVVCEDGTLEVWEKESGRHYSGAGELEDVADLGDEYNFSGAPDDECFRSGGKPAEIEVPEQTALRTTVRIRHMPELPACYDREKGHRSARRRNVPVELLVSLTADSRVLDFQIRVQNTVKDHRLRLLFPTDLKADRSFARVQFDIVKHPIVPEGPQEGSLPEKVKRVVIGARENGACHCFPQGDFCGISDGRDTAAVLNKGLPEYEILEERNTIAVTLCRSVSWLARTDLRSRMGDAGPFILTPDAACLRRMEFSLGFCPFHGSWEEAGLNCLADLYRAPVMVLKTAAPDLYNGADVSEQKETTAVEQKKTVAVEQKEITAVEQGKTAATDRQGFLRISGGENLAVTSLRIKDGELQLRLYHPGSGQKTVRLFIGFPVQCAKAVTLAGEETETLLERIPGSGYEVSVGAHQIKTIVFVRGTGTFVPEWMPTNCEEKFQNRGRLLRERPAFSCPSVQAASEPVITWEETKGEKSREQAQKQAYLGAAEAYEKAGGLLNRETAGLYQERESLKRTWLETRLSALYAEEKCQLRQGELGEAEKLLQEEIRGTAAQLCETRLTKRAGEYVVDYYAHEFESGQAGKRY